MLSESKLQTIISPPSGLTVRLTGVRPTSSRASTLSSLWAGLCSWIDATCDDPEQATKAFVESGRIAMSSGCWQTGRVERTRNVFASITETVLSPRLETTTVEPSGETRASPGDAPTRKLPITIRLSRLVMLTLAGAGVVREGR